MSKFNYTKHSAAYATTRACTGFRSKLEVAVAAALKEAEADFQYESIVLPYSRPCTYRPDFILIKQGIIIEAKGIFDADDRRKMAIIKQTYPDLDIRFIFSNPATVIGSKSRTTYGDWAGAHGFPYSKITIPKSWLNHIPTTKTKEALSAFFHNHGPQVH